MYPLQKGERIFYLGFGALILLLASLPYLVGYYTTPPRYVYTGLTTNIDDVAVYYSWIRQAASGELLQRNLFNTGAQSGGYINVFSLLLGNIVRLTGLSVPAVYHIARVAFGALFLWASVRLLQETVSKPRNRQIAFTLLCVGSGFGWVLGGRDPARGFEQPIDLWQTEAIPFLSLYYTPLFCAALALMVLFIVSVIRSEQSGKFTDAIPAAICGVLLANFHTYDIIPLFSVWFVFRAIQDATARQFHSKAWFRFFFAAILTALSLAYTYFTLIADPVFKMRNVQTLMASPVNVVLGFGLPLIFAILGRIPLPGDETPDEPPTAHNDFILVVWAFVGITLPYLPVEYQRKMLMGAYVPITMLAGVAISTLAFRLPSDFPKIAIGFLVILSSLTNILFLVQDTDRLKQNIGSTDFRPYLTQGEADALTWLRQNGKTGEGVLCSPDPTAHKRFPFIPLKPYLSVYVPAYTGLQVYNGHWSETAGYGNKWIAANRFFQLAAPDDYRKELLQKANVQYVLYAASLAEGTPITPDGSPLMDIDNRPFIPPDWIRESPPPYLETVYSNTDVVIFRVRL